MENTLFTKKDSGFICLNCGKEVPPLGYSSRNHCPFCLCSRHVDVNPGDRASECGAVMDPVEVRTEAKRGFVITHKCRKCGFISKNKAAMKNAKSTLPDSQYDDEDFLIKLTVSRDW